MSSLTLTPFVNVASSATSPGSFGALTRRNLVSATRSILKMTAVDPSYLTRKALTAPASYSRAS